jgi:hypothetical protein
MRLSPEIEQPVVWGRRASVMQLREIDVEAARVSWVKHIRIE